MDTDETLLDCASVDVASAKALGNAQPWDVVKLWLPSSSKRHSSDMQELTSCVVQVVIATTSPSGENTTLFQANSGEEPKSKKPAMSIHPLLYEFLSTSFATVSNCYGADDENMNTDSCVSNSSESVAQGESSSVSVSVTPLPLAGSNGAYDDTMQTIQDKNGLPWMARRIPSRGQRELPAGSTVSLALLCVDDDLHEYCKEQSENSRDKYHTTLQSTLSFFLEKRMLMKGTTLLLSTLEGMAIATVKDIMINGPVTASKNRFDTDSDDIVYSLGNADDYDFKFLYDDEITCSREEDATQEYSPARITWQPDCPGYEKLLQTLLQITSLKGSAAPSGILLTGSPQVGKTHLASCVAYHLSRASTNPALVHWVSVQDLVMQASWASESDLLNILRPPSRAKSSLNHYPNQLQLLVIDDLHIFATQESALQEDSISINLDPEMMVVRNSVLQIIDELASPRNTKSDKDSTVSILGIAQSTSNLPAEFVRSGRLEKEISMLPPTQSQREIILNRTIPTLAIGAGISDRITRRWAEALSPVTVGCVAGDLCRVLSAAWTRATARGWKPGEDISCPDLRWEDLQTSAQTYVPIQLENIDVCKPQSFLSVDHFGEEPPLDPHDWAKIHELSWAAFAGYPMVKKRLLRTVVGPWRRFLVSIDSEEQGETAAPLGLSPPPGVLFYGESGNGKSFAASLLASSLGLPMIIVKAADVMDKWLGGSEAIIRSLFTRARSAAPCILFFDEIDAIATNRAGGDEGGAEVMSRLLSTLLNEMDGISSDKQKHSVLVVACTNRLEELDAALLRPGRLEEHIHLEHPEESDVMAMLQLYLSKVPLSDSTNLEALAAELAKRHATGADVQGICHEACLNAIHRADSQDVVLLPEDVNQALQTSRLS